MAVRTWAAAVDELERRYRACRTPVERSHWHLLWLVARGYGVPEAAALVGYRADWADENRLDAGPVEFAALAAGAEAVATTYFHGCCFALVNGKPLVCAPSDYRWNKVRDLTALLGAERHLTFAENDPAQVDALYADDAVLLPTVAPGVLDTSAERIGYFDAFLKKRPTGTIDESVVRDLGDGYASNTGLYTFALAETGELVHARFTFVYEEIDGEWKIIEHHSSKEPVTP